MKESNCPLLLNWFERNGHKNYVQIVVYYISAFNRKVKSSTVYYFILQITI